MFSHTLSELGPLAIYGDNAPLKTNNKATRMYIYIYIYIYFFMYIRMQSKDEGTHPNCMNSIVKDFEQHNFENKCHRYLHMSEVNKNKSEISVHEWLLCT